MTFDTAEIGWEVGLSLGFEIDGGVKKLNGEVNIIKFLFCRVDVAFFFSPRILPAAGGKID